MKNIFTKKKIGYIALITFVVVLSGFILFPVVSNYYVLSAVLVIQWIILLIIMYFFYDKYVKPIEVASDTMDKLLQGNYHARVHHAMDGTIGERSEEHTSELQSRGH